MKNLLSDVVVPARLHRLLLVQYMMDCGKNANIYHIIIAMKMAAIQNVWLPDDYFGWKGFLRYSGICKHLYEIKVHLCVSVINTGIQRCT